MGRLFHHDVSIRNFTTSCHAVPIILLPLTPLSPLHLVLPAPLDFLMTPKIQSQCVPSYRQSATTNTILLENPPYSHQHSSHYSHNQATRYKIVDFPCSTAIPSPTMPTQQHHNGYRAFLNSRLLSAKTIFLTRRFFPSHTFLVHVKLKFSILCAYLGQLPTKYVFVLVFSTGTYPWGWLRGTRGLLFFVYRNFWQVVVTATENFHFHFTQTKNV